ALRNAFGWEEDEPIVGTLLAIRDAVMSIGTWITDTAIPAVVDFGQWLWSIRGWLLPIAGAVLGIVAAWKTYQTIMAVVRGVTVAFTAVQTALNVVMAMNPIGLIVLALVGLAAAFVVAWHRSETFRNIVTGAWEAIKSAGVAVWDWLKGAFDWLKDAFASVADWFSDRGDDIQYVWQLIQIALRKAWIWIQVNVFTPIRKGIALVKMGFDAAKDGIGAAWDAIKSWLKSGWD